MMKRHFLIFITLISVAGLLIFVGCHKETHLKGSNQEYNIKLVSDTLAMKIAQKFNPAIYFEKGRDASAKYQRKNSGYVLNGDNEIASSITFKDHKNKPAFYVYNFVDSSGTLIVSADFNIAPILAYIPQGTFSRTENRPVGLTDWINKTIQDVEVVRKGLYDNSKDAQIAWTAYIDEYDVPVTPNRYPFPPSEPSPATCDNMPSPPIQSMTVGPLLSTTWGQGCTYNDSCDLAYTYNCVACNDRPMTGCVATTMAQIIKYHEHPNSNYNYSSMPNTSGNSEVQKLMRDAGESVNMDYGCASGAYGDDIPTALKNTFGYSSANWWSYSNSSSDFNRIYHNILDSSQPVILGGQDNSAGGHAWVCDGVHTRTDYICMDGKLYVSEYSPTLHMNWGWHEVFGGDDYNGWYIHNKWRISDRNINFQYYQYAITEIHP